MYMYVEEVTDELYQKITQSKVNLFLHVQYIVLESVWYLKISKLSNCAKN